MSKKSIISIPHPVLRDIASVVESVDLELLTLMTELEDTLKSARNPRGVGLAANQIATTRRVFSTFLNEDFRIFINPVIIKHSPQTTLGGTPDDPDLEGCLSIPGLYGPVPRWQWIELEYQVISGEKLVTTRERFEFFPARVIQHERDHLDGILFLDHSVAYDLPVFEGSRDDALEPVDPLVIETLVTKSKQ